jgi:hypothetical protein
MPSAGISQAQIVAVLGDVERAHRDLFVLDVLEPLGQAAGQCHAAGGDSEEHHVAGALGAFHDLVGDPGDDPVDVGCLEDGPGGCRVEVAGAGTRMGRCLGHANADLLPRLTGRALKDVG